MSSKWDDYKYTETAPSGVKVKSTVPIKQVEGWFKTIKGIYRAAWWRYLHSPIPGGPEAYKKMKAEAKAAKKNAPVRRKGDC